MKDEWKVFIRGVEGRGDEVIKPYEGNEDKAGKEVSNG